MLEAQRETDKRLLVAKEFVENVGSMAVGIVLVGSVAYAPNENVTELSDLDLVVIYDDVKDSVPAYFRDEEEQKYLLSANYDGYQVKRKMNGISVSIHNISYNAFKKIIEGHCGTLDYYRQSQKDITYISLDFNGKEHPFKLNSKQVEGQPGVRREEIVTFEREGNYVIGNDIDKFLSNAKILHDKDARVERGVSALWENAVKRMLDHTIDRGLTINFNDVSIVKVLCRKKKFSTDVSNDLGTRTISTLKRLVK